MSGTATAGPVDVRRPVKLLVIQLARLGDTIQSLMALRAAKQLYPELEIHFVARSKFADAVKRVPWVAGVHVLPTEELLSPILQGKDSGAGVIPELARWLTPLVSVKWDFVANWTYSNASSYLSALVPGGVKLGFTRGNDLSMLCADGWSYYVQGVIQGQVSQSIHLTDVLTTQLLTALQIHVGEPDSSAQSRPVTSKDFFNLNSSGANEVPAVMRGMKKWVAVQLGAGREDKTYSPSNWASVVSSILRRHPDTSVVLLGGAKERALEEEVQRLLLLDQGSSWDSDRLISLVGDTSFDRWASVVARCQWVLATDTSVIHLASVLGTRVFNLSIGPVRWMETGPYGNGHYVIAPVPGAPLSPAVVYAAWAYASSEWSHQRRRPIDAHFEALGLSQEIKDVRVFRSHVRGSEEGGGVVYEPVNRQPLSVSGWVALVMGQVARNWFCGWAPPVGKDLVEESVTTSLVSELRDLQAPLSEFKKICEDAIQASRQIYSKCSRMKSTHVMPLDDRNELQSLAAELTQCDARMKRLGAQSPQLMGFSQMSQVMMHNLPQTHLRDMGRESVECFKQLESGLGVFSDWLAYTLELVKPKLVKTSHLSLVPPPEKEV